MKRKVILLCAVTLFLASCICLLIFLYQQPQPAPTAFSQETAPSAVSLFPAGEIPRRICVENEAGGFIIRSDTEGSLSVEGITSELTEPSLLASCLQLTSNSSLELAATAPEDPLQFGIETPQATIHFEYDNRSLYFKVGGAVPGQNAYYAKLENSADIYLWYGAGVFLRDAKAFITTQLTPPLSAVTQGPNDITFGGFARETPFSIVQNDAENIVYINVRNKSRRADRQAAENLTASLLSLKAEAVEAYITLDAELASYGLDTPYSTVSFSYLDADKQKQHVILCASEPVGGNVYLTCNGRSVVYRALSETLPWLSVQYEDIVSRLPMLFPIEDVQSVVIKGPERIGIFTLSEKDGKLLVTGEDSVPIKAEDFRDLYQCLIGIPGEEYVRSAIPDNAEELIRVTFTFHDGRAPAVMQLFEGPSLQAYLSVNGEIEFLTKSRYAEIILENLQRIESGDNILPLY